MFILEITAAFAVAGLALASIVAFNRFTTREYGHRFFGWLPLVVGAVGVWSVIGGVGMAQSADTMTAGALLAIAGAVVTLALVAINVRRTSPLVGLAGSGAQLAASAAVGFLGAALAVPALFLAVAAGFGRAEPTIRHGRVYHDVANG